MTDILSYGSVFSGVGGLDLAVEELTGAKAAWHCESDLHASKVLAAHWPGVSNLGDITQVDWASVPQVDIIAGGFPCQDISNAGKRAGIKEGNRSGLWFSYADAIGVLRPRLVVVENVRALLRNGLDVVLGSLSDLGYDARWTCLRASDVGAPHQRERVFLVAWPRGNREGLGWLRGQPALPAEAGPNLPPTPRARDHKGPGFGDDLPAVARLLPTPSASNFNDGEDLQAWQERRAATKERVGNGNGFGTPLSIAVRLDWGEYDPAVRRWAGVVGRPAPRPTCDEAGQRLNPALSEWMMGWPEGWVTDVVERRHALKQCGNGVVTRQAIAALSSLADPPAASVAPDILSTHQWRGNAQMFAEAVRPLYIRDEDAVLDVTYGLGVFWNDWRPPNLTAHDREPSKAPNGPMDFTALAYRDASFDVSVIDVPFKLTGTSTDTDRYGTDEDATVAERHDSMLLGFHECERVTKVGGYVMVKCMAQVAGGTLHPQDAIVWVESLDMDLKLRARYTLVTNPRPQPKVNPDGSPRPQVSPRNNQSTLLVFQKVRRRRP